MNSLIQLSDSWAAEEPQSDVTMSENEVEAAKANGQVLKMSAEKKYTKKVSKKTAATIRKAKKDGVKK